MKIKVNKPTKEEWNNYSKYSDYIAEPKLDGIRCFLIKENGNLKLIRENGNVKTEQFPEIIQNVSHIPDGTVIDGEICILKNDMFANFFELLQRNATNNLKIRTLSKSMPATFMAFDILKHEGQDLTKNILSDRKDILMKIPENERLKQITMFDPKEILPMVEKFNMEGIVLKHLNSEYYSEWKKFKYFYEDDFKVIGFTSEVNPISALELEDKDKNYVGKVNYTGYPQTEEWKKKLKGMTAVVRYMKTNTLKLRHPILVELRA